MKIVFVLTLLLIAGCTNSHTVFAEYSPIPIDDRCVSFGEADKIEKFETFDEAARWINSKHLKDPVIKDQYKAFYVFYRVRECFEQRKEK